MKKALIVLLLSGCATAQQTHLPDGSVGYSLDCSGQARGWNMCLERAGELCGARGYNVLWSNEGPTGMVFTASQYGAFSTTTHPRNMVVQCR